MTAMEGKITVVNTLESRLELLAGQVRCLVSPLTVFQLRNSDFQMMPEIRYILFGENPSRRHKD